MKLIISLQENFYNAKGSETKGVLISDAMASSGQTYCIL